MDAATHSAGARSAAAGAAAASTSHKPEVNHESLSLKVDLDAQRVEGQATLWVVLPALASDAEPEQQSPIDYKLHARQMAISAVRVNGEPVPFTYPGPSLDILRKFVPGEGEERSGEAADLYYRSLFVAAQEGELGLQLPPGEGWKAERDAGEGEAVPKVILNMLNMRNVRVFKVEVDYMLERPTAGLRFESRPQHCYSLRCPGVLHDVDGPRCWFPCSDRTSELFSLDVAVGVPDYEEDEEEEPVRMEEEGGVTAAAVEPGREEERQRRPLTVIVGGGQLVSKEKKRYPGNGARAVVWRYAIDTPVAAAAVSLAVGPFAKWVDPAAPRISHYYLLSEELEAPGAAGRQGGRVALLPPKVWVKASVAGMGPVLGFLADFFNLTPPHAPPGSSAPLPPHPPPSSAATAGTLEHCTVFVKNLPEAAVPYHGLAMHRAEELHPPTLFDGHLALHFALAEGLLSAWLLPRLRPRLPRDRWIYHGVVGYLLLLYVRRRYGEHEYRYRLLRLMDQVAALERSGQAPPLQPPVDSMLFASDAYNPYGLTLVRAKPPIILHMLEHRIGRKPLRDVLRSMACPVSEEAPPSTAGATAAGGASGSVKTLTPAAQQAATAVRAQALRTIGFLRLCLKTSSRGDFLRNVRESWLEGRGPAYFRIAYSYDRRNAKPELELRVRQVVPHWGRLFTGPLRFRVVEDNGTYEYEREISEAEHTFTFKLHSKVRKTGGGRRKAAASAAAAAVASGASSAAPSGAEEQEDDDLSTVGGGIVKKEKGGGGEKPKKRQKKGAAADADGNGVAAAATPTAPAIAGGGRQAGPEDEYAAARREHFSPVVLVQVDPDLQWLTEVQWELPEYCLVEQLHRVPDAAAQCLALRALAAYPRPGQEAAVAFGGVGARSSLAAQAMFDCVRGRVGSGWVEPPLCVRVEAARALAAWQNNHAPAAALNEPDGQWRGLLFLLRAYRERFFDATQRLPLPADFSNEAEYQLQKALVHAASCVRARDGGTPPQVWDFLRAVLEGHDNARNPFHDAAFLRTCLLAVANLRPPPNAPTEAVRLVQGLFPHVQRLVAWYQEPPQPDGLLLPAASAYSSTSSAAAAAAADAILGKDPGHTVLAAVVRALCNLEICRGGQPGALNYLQYARPTPFIGGPSSFLPFDCLDLRLAAVEAVCQLRVLEQATTAATTPEGPRQAVRWLVRMLEHEAAGWRFSGPGSLAFRYRALQVLFETLRRPKHAACRPFFPRPHLAVALAHGGHLLDHLDHEAPQYQPLDAAAFDPSRPPPSSLESPALQALRHSSPPGLTAAVRASAAAASVPAPPLPSGVLALLETEAAGAVDAAADTRALRAKAAESLAAARTAVWDLVQEGTWTCQPLRAMALCLYQLIWGYDGASTCSNGGGGETEPSGAGSSSAATGAGGVPGFAKGLKDVYMELLDMRAKGAMSLRPTLFDQRDWRTADARGGGGGKGVKGGSSGGGGSSKGPGGGALSDEERRERVSCRERREAMRKKDTTLKLRVSQSFAGLASAGAAAAAAPPPSPVSGTGREAFE